MKYGGNKMSKVKITLIVITASVITILLPYSLFSQVFENSCYMIELAEPDSGHISCSAIDVSADVGYRLFILEDCAVSNTVQYKWAGGSSGYANIESDASGEPLCYRKDEDGIFKSHRGEDIYAPVGTRIITCYPCTLIYAGYQEYKPPANHGYWNCYYIPALDISVFLSHLGSSFSSVLYDEDRYYSIGDIIGYSGTSGRNVTKNENPHIHIEIRPGRIVVEDNFPFRTGTTRPTPYLFGYPDKHPDAEVMLKIYRDSSHADSSTVEDNLASTQIYTPDSDIYVRYKNPCNNIGYIHSFSISSYPDGLMTASGAVCTTAAFPPVRDILAEDSRSCAKVCGNYAFVAQTGGSTEWTAVSDYETCVAA